MFCQCIFNSDGDIIEKAGTVEGVELKSKSITSLFKEIGIKEKEWKLEKQYEAYYGNKKFRCVATKVGDNFQFIGVDISFEDDLKEQLESQQRISDLNLNRLLKTLDKLRDKNAQLENDLRQKNDVLSSAANQLRNSLNDMLGYIEIMEESPEADQKQLVELLKNSSQELIQVAKEFHN